MSGGGSQPAHVGRGDAAFAEGTTGFAEVTYYADGSSWLELRASDGAVLFRTELQEPARELVDPQVALKRTEAALVAGGDLATGDAGAPDSGRDVTGASVKDAARIGSGVSVEDAALNRTGDAAPDRGRDRTGASTEQAARTVTVAANPEYVRRGLDKFILGGHHREVWATPVEVPVLDVAAEGLTPVKRGGGLQTISLRLRDEGEQEYVLRTIDKHPMKSIPPRLRETLVPDLMKDQVASLHPYGAFAVPRLAEAAGIYHARPRLVYVPKDPRLGIYADLVAEQLMLLEERADEDQSDRPYFGRSKNVIGTPKLFQELKADNDHRVDQPFYLRSRLFDLLIADWDRHEDQWRWASFEPYELDSTLEGEERKRGKIYRPIPRDRDWAFNRRTGPPSLIKYVDFKFQNFDHDYGNVQGLTLNALPLDRRFLNEMTRRNFVETARDLKAALSDEVIEQAVRDWPQAIYELHGEETAAMLKSRRDALPQIAEQYYALHAGVVDVVGSNKHERFEVTHARDSVRVVVWKTKKDGDVVTQIYERTFSPDETREVRLFGLDGNDRFYVRGVNAGRITVRVIGGPGDDLFSDAARHHRRRAHTEFYDSNHSGNVWEIGQDARVIRSTDPSVNRYDPHGFRYDVVMPVTFFGANDDDGLFLGGGFRYLRQGFRKEPHASEHIVKANLATRTTGFNVTYDGHFVGLAGPWDGRLHLAYLSPNNIRNFFGLGNETEDTDRDRKFYQAQFTEITVQPSISRDMQGGAHFRLGPFLRFTDVRLDEDRFVGRPQAGIARSSFDPQWFVGLRGDVRFETVDDRVNPTEGLRWVSSADINIDVSADADSYTSLSTSVSAYHSVSYAPQVTLAARVGTAHNVGDFPFYRAITLGGRSNLRGYRSTRFAGRTNFYQNVDLRVELFQFSTYLAPGKAGIHAYFDNGRVWTDGENSTAWHQGYGGGLWLELFGQYILQATTGFSVDDTIFTVGFDFFF